MHANNHNTDRVDHYNFHLQAHVYHTAIRGKVWNDLKLHLIFSGYFAGRVACIAIMRGIIVAGSCLSRLKLEARRLISKKGRSHLPELSERGEEEL